MSFEAEKEFRWNRKKKKKTWKPGDLFRNIIIPFVVCTAYQVLHHRLQNSSSSTFERNDAATCCCRRQPLVLHHRCTSIQISCKLRISVGFSYDTIQFPAPLATILLFDLVTFMPIMSFILQLRNKTKFFAICLVFVRFWHLKTHVITIATQS